jgi:hypothetical protein
MNMEFIEWPIFMPQFYTAPNTSKNASLRFKNEYNYNIANSFSIGIGIAHSGKNSRFSCAETADI